jgi:hypothetical protein
MTCDQCVTRRPVGPLDYKSHRPVTCGFGNYIACARGELNPHTLSGTRT